MHLSDAEMAKILEITEGWAISLSLLAEQWHHVSLDYWLMISPNDLFTYLSEEVYSRMTATEQETILKLAIFPTFSAELLEDFYGFEMAQMLNTLSQRHLFIQPVTTDGLYRFHALFSRFLEMKWRQHTSYYTDLHKQATFYYMERHNIQAVLYHAFKTNDHDFCGELLQRHAEPLVRAGQFEWLLEKINRFTVQEKDTFYRLYYFDGECHRYRAYYERAKQSYDKCAMIAQQQQDHLFMTKSQAGLAHIYLDTIQPALAEPYLEKALELAKYTPLLKRNY